MREKHRGTVEKDRATVLKVTSRKRNCVQGIRGKETALVEGLRVVEQGFRGQEKTILPCCYFGLESLGPRPSKARQKKSEVKVFTRKTVWISYARGKETTEVLWLSLLRGVESRQEQSRAVKSS